MTWYCTNCSASLTRDLTIHTKPVYFCEGCDSKFIIIEGDVPKIYLYSVIICISKGEAHHGETPEELRRKIAIAHGNPYPEEVREI